MEISLPLPEDAGTATINGSTFSTTVNVGTTQTIILEDIIVSSGLERGSGRRVEFNVTVEDNFQACVDAPDNDAAGETGRITINSVREI